MFLYNIMTLIVVLISLRQLEALDSHSRSKYLKQGSVNFVSFADFDPSIHPDFSLLISREGTIRTDLANALVLTNPSTPLGKGFSSVIVLFRLIRSLLVAGQ